MLWCSVCNADVVTVSQGGTEQRKCTMLPRRWRYSGLHDAPYVLDSESENAWVDSCVDANEKLPESSHQ